MIDQDICCFPKCKGKVEIFYCGKSLCDKHWNKLSEKTPEEVKSILSIKETKKNET